jgi:hypothetical protein
MPEPPVDFDLFRRVAETASAYRYKDVWITVEPDPSGHPVIKVYDEPPTCKDCAIYHITKVPYGPPPPVAVAVIGSSTTTVNLLQLKVPEGQMIPAGTYAADAVFWSQSAVEKFMIPYYASVYGDQADVIVQKLLNVLKPAAAPDPDGSEPDQAFAIAHLPNSEYVTVSDSLPHLAVLWESGHVEGIGRG